MKKHILFLFSVVTLFSACDSPQEIKYKQYLAEGFELYKRHCANCHQTDGKGLGNLYPPLLASDYLPNRKSLVACAIRYGQADTLVVNGQTYTQPMPANKDLTDMEIAEILTFVYSEWGNEKGITETQTIAKVLEGCKKGRNE